MGSFIQKEDRKDIKIRLEKSSDYNSPLLIDFNGTTINQAGKLSTFAWGQLSGCTDLLCDK